MSKKTFYLLAALSCAAMSAAQAAPITYNFSGTFSSASGTGASLLGVAFSGQLQYDPAAALVASGGNYKGYASPAGALTVSAGGGVVTSGEGVQEVINGTINFESVYSDVLRVLASTSSGTGILGGFDFIEIYQDIELNVLQSLTLPPEMLALGDARLLDMGIVGVGPFVNGTFGGYLQGAVTCFSTRAGDCGRGPSVPEPGVLFLVGAAIAAGFGVTRKRARGQKTAV